MHKITHLSDNNADGGERQKTRVYVISAQEKDPQVININREPSTTARLIALRCVRVLNPQINQNDNYALVNERHCCRKGFSCSKQLVELFRDQNYTLIYVGEPIVYFEISEKPSTQGRTPFS